jgi:hypothetical protein
LKLAAYPVDLPSAFVVNEALPGYADPGASP